MMNNKDLQNIANISIRLALEEIFSKDKRKELTKTIADYLINKNGNLKPNEDCYLSFNDCNGNAGLITNSKSKISIDIKTENLFPPIVRNQKLSSSTFETEFWNDGEHRYDIANVKYSPLANSFSISCDSLEEAVINSLDILAVEDRTKTKKQKTKLKHS